jgi:transcriptional regulator with XRE-family HTH domain
MDMQEYGQLLREYRKKAHLSQQQLADYSGINRSTISLIETGSIGEIGVRKLDTLCERVGLRLQIVPRQLPSFHEALDESAKAKTAALEESSKLLGKPSNRRKRK